MRQHRLTTCFLLVQHVSPPPCVSEEGAFVSPSLEPDNWLKGRIDDTCKIQVGLTHAYFLIRNASLAWNSLAFSSSFLKNDIFKTVLVVMTITFTHFLRHLTLGVRYMVEVEFQTLPSYFITEFPKLWFEIIDSARIWIRWLVPDHAPFSIFSCMG